LRVLDERAFPVRELRALASERSAGTTITFRGEPVRVELARPEAFDGVDFAFFAATGELSKTLGPEVAKRGGIAIDKSSTWRMDPNVPLVVPEVNGAAVEKHRGIIANPNCTTTPFVMALGALRQRAKLRRAVITTLQSVTGAGLRNSYQKEIAATVDLKRSESAKAAHSVYFGMLGGAGFVGLAIYLSVLAAAFLTALSLHLRRRDPSVEPWMARFGYFAQMSLAVFGVGGATVSIEMWDGYLIIVALIAALTKIEKTSAQTLPQAAPNERYSWRIKARGGPLRPKASRDQA